MMPSTPLFIEIDCTACDGIIPVDGPVWVDPGSIGCLMGAPSPDGDPWRLHLYIRGGPVLQVRDGERFLRDLEEAGVVLRRLAVADDVADDLFDPFADA